MGKNTFEYKGFQITIEQDETAEYPREAFHTLGTLVVLANAPIEGDVTGGSPEEYEALIRGGAVVLPVYCLDHSGIRVSTRPFGCPWDSGQVGYICIDKETLVKEYGADTPEARDKAKNVLREEIEVVDQWATGEVYAFRIEKTHECECCGITSCEEVDLVGGLYGYECAVQEAKNTVDLMRK